MMLVVSYDVDTTDAAGVKRLRQVAKICESYGIRVQNSVFEVSVDPAQKVALLARLSNTIDSEKDSVRIYRLGSNWKGKVEYLGCVPRIQQEDVMIL